MNSFFEAMSSRGLVKQVNHGEDLSTHLSSKRTAYAGFDPTANSLHVGHLLPLMMLSRWQKMGHRSIVLFGGGTAMVGDPSGKTSMRKMLTPEEIESNIERINLLVQPIVDVKNPDRGLSVNNADWLLSLNYISFLREIGQHFSVNRMLTAECFKSRLESGLSFLEFNYMLLQSYDFLMLYDRHQCTVQLGGDDQWSNMLSGTDLIRRTRQGDAFCMTSPLLTTTDGRKMGKTESGAIWLDPDLTPPFEYFQFWRNVEDLRVFDCMRYFTFFPTEEIDQMEKDWESSSRDHHLINDAKVRLAQESTSLLHGPDEAKKCVDRASSQFTSGPSASVNAEHVIIDLTRCSEQILSRCSEQNLVGTQKQLTALELLVLSGKTPSNGEAKRLIRGGGVMILDQKVSDPNQLYDIADFKKSDGGLVRLGKKIFFRLLIQG